MSVQDDITRMVWNLEVPPNTSVSIDTYNHDVETRIDQPLTPDFATRKDELTYRLEGVEAAMQSATRMDDQEWLAWLKTRRDDLQGQLAKEQAQ